MCKEKPVRKTERTSAGKEKFNQKSIKIVPCCKTMKKIKTEEHPINLYKKCNRRKLRGRKSCLQLIYATETDTETD